MIDWASKRWPEILNKGVSGLKSDEKDMYDAFIAPLKQEIESPAYLREVMRGSEDPNQRIFENVPEPIKTTFMNITK